MVGFAILIIICTGMRSATAGDKIDVPKVITKSDAEKILGVPVKDAKGHNQTGKGGHYESEWSYRAIEGDKGGLFRPSLCGTRRSAASYADNVFHAAGRWQQIDSYRCSW